MSNIALGLYKYVDGVNDTPFPSSANQAFLLDWQYGARRMGGAPSITGGTIYHKDCLDDEWNMDVYVEYKGEKFFPNHKPTSSYSAQSIVYEHKVDFHSERAVLDNVYFYDVVNIGDSGDKPISNSTKFTFFGNISEFIARLNASMQRANTGYSVVLDPNQENADLEKRIKFDTKYISEALQEGFKAFGIPYYFVGKVCHYGDSQSSVIDNIVFEYGQDKSLMSIEKTNANTKIINRITGFGSSDNIPYYYPNSCEQGVVDIANLSSSTITDLEIFDDMLFAKKVKRDAVLTYNMWSFNVDTPIFYLDGKPYTNGKGFTSDEIAQGQTLHVVVPFEVKYDGCTNLFMRFSVRPVATAISNMSLSPAISGVTPTADNGMVYVNALNKNIAKGRYQLAFDVNISTFSLILQIFKTESCTIYAEGWKDSIDGNFYKDLEEIGIMMTGTARAGDNFKQIISKYIPPQSNLMPSIYRQSDGDERFYNATNNTYVNPDTGEYYEFPNPYTNGKPKEFIKDYKDVKPTIAGALNSANEPIDQIIKFAFDENDNDEMDEEGNYIHPYFFALLHKTNGTYGFNLFDHTIDENEMSLSFTSGRMGGCEFVIGVGEDSQKNLVQIALDGNLQPQLDEDGHPILVRDAETGDVICGREGQGTQIPQDWQNDTRRNEVWVALKKDITTYGIVMPNATNGYRPDDEEVNEFVILHIDLPKAYILAAEQSIDNLLISYMAESNTEHWNFSIDYSRIYLKNTPNVANALDENKKIKIRYNGEIYSRYILGYTYKTLIGEPLPSISIELAESLEGSTSALDTAINEINNMVEQQAQAMIGYQQVARLARAALPALKVQNAGSRTLPIYFDGIDAKPIEGLEVPEKIYTPKTVTGMLGVIAGGVGSLNIGGGGGQGTVTGINFAGSPGTIYEPSDGLITLPDYPSLSGYATQNWVTNNFAGKSYENRVVAIEGLIPAQASTSNQLADKSFVNSSIATATATHQGSYNLITDLNLTTSATRSQIAAALASSVSGADNNDYVFVEIPTSDSTPTQVARVERYKYNGSAWAYEYTLNNSGFTAAQWASLNSGVTSAHVTKLGHIEDYAQVNKIEVIKVNGTAQTITNKAVDISVPTALSQLTADATHRLVTDAQISTWNAKYDKPSGGIPKTDLASAVQTSLGLADTALQSHQTIYNLIIKKNGTQVGSTYNPASAAQTIDITDVASASALSGVTTRVGTLEGYFDGNGNANNAINFDGHDSSFYAVAADYTKTADYKSLTIKGGTTSVGSYSPTSALSFSILAGSNISVTPDATNHTITIANTYSYTLPTASSEVLGGVKVGATLAINDGVLNLKSGIATAGTYKSVTVDSYGRVTAGTNPTTLSGFGITDGVNDYGETGSGNAYTGASISGHKITFTKGATFKTQQTAKSDPTASGTSITFIDTISQNANGEITATKKTVRDASASQSGVVSTSAQTFAGDKTFTGHVRSNKSVRGDLGVVAGGVGSLSMGGGGGTGTVTSVSVNNGTHTLPDDEGNVNLVLAAVALSGNYNDLSNKPTIPTKASWNYDDRYVRFDTASQGLTDTEKANARTNIGAIAGITSSMVTTALGYTPFDSASFTKANIKSTLGIYDWALASAKPSYGFSEISGTVTNAQLAGSIANNKLAHYTITISGEDVDLGEEISQSSLRNALGLGASAYVGYDTTVTQNSTKLITSGAVYNAIDNLPEPMIMKGTLGTNGTITSLPTASASNEGFTYKVITAETYASQAAKVGDVFVSCKPVGASAYEWILIPAGDTDSDTWRNIKVNGTELLGTAISTGAINFKNGGNITLTGSGNDITLGVASGYAIPTTAKQSNWDTAYGWGNHADAGYALAANLGTASAHNHGDYVTAIGVSGNTLTWSKGGTAQTAITVPYATAASKLSTARTIWGRTFDGSANVSGAMSGVTTINGVVSFTNYGSSNPVLNIDTVYAGAGTDYVSMYVTATHRPLVLQMNAGNVGIGVAQPTNKLDVAGAIGLTGQLKSSVATGTAPLSIASTTLVSNLNSEYLGGTKKADLFTAFANDNDQLSSTIGGTNKKVTVGYASRSTDTKTELLTGQEFIYRQTAGGGLTYKPSAAVLKRVLGNSVVWNSLLKSTAPVSIFSIINDSTISYSFSNAEQFYRIVSSKVTTIAGHKYYLYIKQTGDGVLRTVIAGDISYFSQSQITAGIKIIITGTGVETFIHLTNDQYTSGSGTFTFTFIDLTLFFNGNIPEGLTAETFERDYGYLLANPEYNEGQVINNAAKGLETVGFNLWDEEWSVGDYVSGSLNAKNFIGVEPNNVYYLHTSSEGCLIFYYDGSKNLISQEGVLNTEFTTPNGCRFIKFRLSTNYGTIYKHDTCINLSDPNRNGQYEPYKKNVLSIFPLKCKAPNGDIVIITDGRLAGSVRDERVGNKFIQRVGDYNMTRAWQRSVYQGVYYFSSSIYTIKADTKNICCSKYVFDKNHIYISDLIDKSFIVNNDTVYFRDDSKTTGEAFTEYVNGSHIYFELATPIEYEIIDEAPYEYPIDVLGTERMVSDELVAPFVADIQYGAEQRDIAVDINNLHISAGLLSNRASALESYFTNGIANNAARLSNTSAIGSTTKPVYFTANGVPSACSDYAGGTAVTLNGTSKAANTASFYAPTGAGTSGQILKSTAGAPEWINQSAITAGALTTVSKTAWGQTYWTSGGVPTNVSGDMSSVGNIAFQASGKNIGGTLYFDTTNHYLGVNISTPDCALDVDGVIHATKSIVSKNGGVIAGGIGSLFMSGAGGGGTVNGIKFGSATAITPDDDGILNVSALSAGIITQDATHRMVSDSQVSTWNSKQDAIAGGTEYTEPSTYTLNGTGSPRIDYIHPSSATQSALAINVPSASNVTLWGVWQYIAIIGYQTIKTPSSQTGWQIFPAADSYLKIDSDQGGVVVGYMFTKIDNTNTIIFKAGQYMYDA